MSANAINNIPQANAGFSPTGSTSNLILNTVDDIENSSLKHFVESIENNRMCFTPSQNGIDLSWNKEYLLSSNKPN